MRKLFLCFYRLIFNILILFFFFLNDPAPPEISPLPLPAALPLSGPLPRLARRAAHAARAAAGSAAPRAERAVAADPGALPLGVRARRRRLPPRGERLRRARGARADLPRARGAAADRVASRGARRGHRSPALPARHRRGAHAAP